MTTMFDPLWALCLALRCAAFTLPWLLYLFIADFLLSCLLPLSAVAPDLAYNLSSNIAESVWHGIQLIFTRINRAKIVVSGIDALPPGESAIVVSNHVQWCDFYLIQELASRSGMLGRCRYFAKRQLKWVPFLGWGLWAMGMPLVSRKWTQDQREMDRVFNGILQRRWPVCETPHQSCLTTEYVDEVAKRVAGLISYSEATRITASKRAAAETWCKDNDKPLGKHVLYPRTKGFIACVQKLRQAPHVKAVYDVTIAYAKDGQLFQMPPTFGQTLYRPQLDRTWTFHVHVDRYELANLPPRDDQLAQWLERRWLDKGDRLEVLKQQLSRREPWKGDTLSTSKLE